MGRGKLRMELINEVKKRNLTFKKRKQGLFTKIHEFTTLCQVPACMIIYGPKHETGSTSEPYIWPHEDLDRVHRMIDLYKSNDNHVCAANRTFGLSDFFKDKGRKIEDELDKLRKKRIETKYPTNLDHGANLNDWSVAKLREFSADLSNKSEMIKSRIELLKRIKQQQLALMTDKGSLVNFAHNNNSFCNYAPPSMRSGADLEFHNQIQLQQHGISTNVGMQHYNSPSACSQFGGSSTFNNQVYYDSTMVDPTVYSLPFQSYEPPFQSAPVHRQVYYDSTMVLDPTVYDQLPGQSCNKPPLLPRPIQPGQIPASTYMSMASGVAPLQQIESWEGHMNNFDGKCGTINDTIINQFMMN